MLITFLYTIPKMAGVFSVLKDFIWDHRALTGVASVVGIGALVFVVKRSKRNTYTRTCGVDYPKDTVIVHVGFTDGKHVPSLSHFCLKLMTYLRVTGIPFKVCYTAIEGPKNKIPWIEYNGTVLGDSQMIVKFLNKEFNNNLNTHLSTEQQALAWAIQKWMEEFLYWMNVHTRWVLYPEEMFETGLNKVLDSTIIRAGIPKNVQKMTYVAGIGRHTKNEISEMIQFDLRQFSTILGDKKYIMGSDMAEVDCAAFGVIGQIYYQTPASCKGLQLLQASDEMKNVRDYLNRIKTEYWPDWNEQCLK